VHSIRYPCVAMARTRSQKANDEVLEAALEVVLCNGVDGFTIDEVVARSRVAKTTIYRWWPNRQALLIDVIRCQLMPAATPNTGDLRVDLLAYLSIFADKPIDTPAARLLPDLCAASRRDPTLSELRDTIIREKRQPVLTLLELAKARGEISLGADLELIATLILGPIAYQRTLCGKVVPMPLVEQILDAALATAAAPAHA